MRLLVFILMLSATFILGTPLAAAVAIGSPAPSLGSTKSLNSADGLAIELSNYRGKVVLVDFWATWCGPCVSSIPHVEELHKKYGKEGLVVIGHTDASSRGLEDMIKSKGMTYLISIGTNIGDDYGVTGIPSVFLIDTKGNIAWNGHPGSLQNATIEGLLAHVSEMSKNGTLPQFPKPSSASKVAAVERKIAAGKVGSGMSDLEKMIEKENDAAEAKSSLDQVAKWRAMVDKEIAAAQEKGDQYKVYELTELLANLLKGHDSEDTYKDKLKDLKDDDAYKIGKEFQKFATVPAEQHSNPAFVSALKKFIAKHESGFYVEQAEALLK